MNGSEATSWLLDGRTGWRTATSAGADATATGLRLDTDPAGPLGLTSPDRSLGGLTLPTWMAITGDGLILLLGRDRLVRRFDPATGQFHPLPSTGGRGTGLRQFRWPQAIAVAGPDLYVADTGNRRVQVFTLAGLALRRVWGPLDEQGRPVDVHHPQAWQPYDLAARGGLVYVLDRRHGRVYRQRAGSDRLEPFVTQPQASRRWTRVAADLAGRVYLLDAAARRLDVYDPQGRPAAPVSDPGTIRDRFPPPAIRVDHLGRFCLPGNLTCRCRREPLASPLPETPLELCPPWSDQAGAPGGLLFDREGGPARVADTDPAPPAYYVTSGTWTSEALDSGIDRCQWHRIELELGQLPVGTKVTVLTYAEQPLPGPGELRRSGSEMEALPEGLWATGYVEAGPLQSPAPAAGFDGHREFLVQSRAGRFLWLRVILQSDGSRTPVVTAIRVHYPRRSYLSYLPAVYAADEDSRWFLERFLSIFQTKWDDLQTVIATFARFADPKAVPAGPALEYLASWLAVQIERTWTADQNRELLKAAPALQPVRGTARGLRGQLRVYLQNITGLAAEDLAGHPRILEAFRERDHLLLSAPGVAELGGRAPLWSPSVVGRLRLGEFATEGQVRLVSTGDPERDLFHHYAHRFRVFIPAAWAPTSTQEQTLRRALNQEKPAHTVYDLCLVEPRLRVGVQATVGIDTIIGAYPSARLACTASEQASPSRAPRHRLGYDTILASRDRAEPRIRLGRDVRVGVNTCLT
jgi:phage tail-like protein